MYKELLQFKRKKDLVKANINRQSIHLENPFEKIRNSGDCSSSDSTLNNMFMCGVFQCKCKGSPGDCSSNCTVFLHQTEQVMMLFLRFSSKFQSPVVIRQKYNSFRFRGLCISHILPQYKGSQHNHKCDPS